MGRKPVLHSAIIITSTSRNESSFSRQNGRTIVFLPVPFGHSFSFLLYFLFRFFEIPLGTRRRSLFFRYSLYRVHRPRGGKRRVVMAGHGAATRFVYAKLVRPPPSFFLVTRRPADFSMLRDNRGSSPGTRVAIKPSPRRFRVFFFSIFPLESSEFRREDREAANRSDARI